MAEGLVGKGPGSSSSRGPISLVDGERPAAQLRQAGGGQIRYVLAVSDDTRTVDGDP